MRNSKVLARLRADEPVLMTNMSLGVNPMGVEMAGRLGYDAVWMDMEHRCFTWREIETMIMAAQLGDVDAMVRIRKQEGYASFIRPLQEGAAGMMIPHVRSAEEAAQWVEYAKYPPIGRRGFENVMRDNDLGFNDNVAYMEHANRETFLVIQIEDVEALESIDEIAAVPGYDILLIGGADLSIGLGVPGQMDAPVMQDAIKRIGESANRHGKWWGMPVGSMEVATKLAKQGARFFNYGGDYGFIRQGLINNRNAFDEAFGTTRQPTVNA